MFIAVTKINKLVIHFLYVTWEFLITVILCCHMLQLHKTNNLCTNYKDHKEAGEHKNCNISFTCNQHKGGNRPSVETPFHTIPAGFVYLSVRAGNVTAGEGDFYELWKCSRT